MTLYELLQLVGNYPHNHSNALLMVRTEDGTMHEVHTATYEIHDDADQSVTIWLDVEEY